MKVIAIKITSVISTVYPFCWRNTIFLSFLHYARLSLWVYVTADVSLYFLTFASVVVKTGERKNTILRAVFLSQC